MLEEIGRARGPGVMQNELSKRVELSPKNLFHHLKKLLSLSLLCKNEVLDMSTTPSVKTNLLRLKRFEAVQLRIATTPHAAVADAQSGTTLDSRKLLAQITTLLAGSPQQALPEVHVKRSFGLFGKKVRGNSVVRWRTLKKRLLDGGHIEEFDANVEGKAETCLRLKKLFSEKEKEKGGGAGAGAVDTAGGDASGDEGDEDAAEGAGNTAADFRNFCAEQPLDYQLFKRIQSHGRDGITQTELYHETGIARKQLVKHCAVLQSAYGVVGIPVTFNKQMTYKLVGTYRLFLF